MINRNFFASEKKKLEGLSLFKKVEYIWDYYKWHIIITLFLIISIISTVSMLSSSKEVVLSGYLLDSYYTTDHDEPFWEFAEYAGMDTTSSQPEFLKNLTLYGVYTETAKQLFSTISAGQTDFVASNPETFLRLSYESYKYFFDLRQVLTKDQLERLSDRLFYVDASMLDSLDTQSGTIILPNPHDPDAMKEPVPIGINIRGGRGVDELYLGESPVYFAIVSNAPHLDMTRTFLEFLFSDK